MVKNALEHQGEPKDEYCFSMLDSGNCKSQIVLNEPLLVLSQAGSSHFVDDMCGRSLDWDVN